MRTSLIRRSTVAITLTAALVLSASACGGDDSADEPATTPAAPADDTAPDATTPADTGAPPTTEAIDPPDPAFTLPVVVYFQADERVAPVRRHVDTMADGLTEGTFQMWLAGPTDEEVAAGYSTTVPPGTRLLSASLENSIMTVDLSSEFASGGGTASVLGRLAELVMTAATSAMVFDGLELRIDGEPVSTFSAEGVVIDGLLTVDDVEDQLPPILQYSVLPGDEVPNGAQISGWANVFEAVVSYQVVDGSGTVIQDATTMASCGTGCRGRFVTWLDFGDHRGPATLRLFEVSAMDGSETGLVTIPFTAVD